MNESLSKRNEELLTSNLELDKQRALVKSHVEKMENLTRELDEKSREATKWKQQEEQKRKMAQDLAQLALPHVDNDNATVLINSWFELKEKECPPEGGE